MLELFERIARRNDKRTESEIQADVRQFILSAPFDLEESDVSVVSLESQLGDRRRIDVEVGSTVIEIKRDLRKGKIKTEAIEQLAGYVQLRMEQSGLRYVGVLTDGTEWVCYDLVEAKLREVSSITVDATASDIERLVVWLEGVLATASDIAPTAINIETRLGAGSSAYALDRASLEALYLRNKDNPTVKMKRTLWSRLLTSALGTAFEDTDALFVEHTLLVNTAEIIAHAVLGLPIQSLNPAALLAGEKFDESGIHGVVEPDFFDWIIEIEEGDVFIRTLAKHPVAVTLARVTYLLAIGRQRLIDPSRNTIHIPVYLGDSLQWQEQNIDLWTAGMGQMAKLEEEGRRGVPGASCRLKEAHWQIWRI